MSVQAMTAVFDIPPGVVTSAERLVLLSIANHANRYGEEAFPGWGTIGAECDLSRATVARCISRLRGRGILESKASDHLSRSGRRLNVYAIRLPGLPGSHGDTPEYPQADAGGLNRDTRRGLTKGLTRGLIGDDRNPKESKDPKDPIETHLATTEPAPEIVGRFGSRRIP